MKQGSETSAIRLEVEIGGTSHEIAWPQDQSLLETLLAADLAAPHSCKIGKCGACVCTLSQGSLFIEENEVLSEEDVADGYVVACRAWPRSDHIKVSF